MFLKVVMVIVLVRLVCLVQGQGEYLFIMLDNLYVAICILYFPLQVSAYKNCMSYSCQNYSYIISIFNILVHRVEG